MSGDRFGACLAAVLKFEGGFVNDPRDPGSATNLGVTLATLSNYRGAPCTVDDVKALTVAAVEPIFRERYWNTIKGDHLPAGLDLIQFDGAVNMGPGTVNRMMQAALGVVADGQLGARTMAALASADIPVLIDQISTARRARYDSLPTFSIYGKGWLNRLSSMTQQALGAAT